MSTLTEKIAEKLGCHWDCASAYGHGCSPSCLEHKQKEARRYAAVVAEWSSSDEVRAALEASLLGRTGHFDLFGTISDVLAAEAVKGAGQ